MHDLDLNEIPLITSDSREVCQGALFVAIEGSSANGQEYIDDAINRGAKVIIYGGNYIPQNKGVEFIKVDDPRIAIAELAARKYNKQPKNIVAVTGTSGKTSVAYYYKQLVELLGKKSASIGTLGTISSDFKQEGKLTTPDVVELHKSLYKLAENNVEYVAVEASSHGLTQHRLDQVKIQAAAITNFSHEHLDYHKTLDGYFAAKMKLFTDLLPTDNIAVLNSDMEQYPEILSLCKNKRVISYGYNAEDLRLLRTEQSAAGLLVAFSYNNEDYQIIFEKIVGDFQALNILCTFGLAIASGFDIKEIVQVASKLVAAPGRMEKVGSANVFVDYAHKVEALEKVMKVMRNSFKGKVVVVFGCGGNRDKEKRPLMGRIAAQYADVVIVTDDNPRKEDPQQIRKEVLDGCPEAIEIADREKAIEYAVSMLETKEDALIIAGKGHEKYQLVGDHILQFDDVAVAEKYLTKQLLT